MVSDNPGYRQGEVDWHGVVTFLALTFTLSWGTWLGLRALHVLFPIAVVIGMFGPAAACGLVRGPIRHEGFGDAGLGFRTPGRRIGRAYLAAYVSVPLLVFAGISLALLTRTQHWALGRNAQGMGHSLVALAGHHATLPPASLSVVMLVAVVAVAFTLGLPINMLFTFGEELGWRGYLLPRLIPFGEVRAALIVGVVWGLWHAPLIVLGGLDFPGHPWAGVGMMVVAAVPLSVILAWLRLRSGSLWPAALAHAALNAQAGFGLLLLSRGDSLLSPPLGIIGIIPFAAFAAWLIWTGRLVRTATSPRPPHP